jgi:serine/threonine protein kinase
MGTVFRAHDRVLGRDVAIKVVSTSAFAQGIAARLAEEQRTMARLEHPGVVPIHDAGSTSDGRSYYVMRLVRGATLEQALRAEPAQAWSVGVRVFERVCETVAFAHAEGVVHCDLKPSNIMAGPFGEVFVMDWGLARFVDQAAPADRAGTPGFMAPEQESRTALGVDGQADVYALGALLAWIMDMAPAAHRPRRTRALRAIIARACAPNPDDRYEGPGALMDDVRRLEAGLPVHAYPESLLERSARVLQRNQTLGVLILVYLLVRSILLVRAR